MNRVVASALEVAKLGKLVASDREKPVTVHVVAHGWLRMQEWLRGAQG